MRFTPLHAFAGAALLFAALAGCAGSAPRADGGGPLRFDGSFPRDSGTVGPDGGGIDHSAECARYCDKLFDCGYFPRPDSPPGYTRTTCVQQCNNVGGFPPESRRTCVDTASCDCDAGGDCHTPDSCFPTLPDGGP